jgi:hypothetical protein
MEATEPQIEQNKNAIIESIDSNNDLETLKEIRIAINKILHRRFQEKVAQVWKEKGYDIESYNNSIGLGA